MPGRKMRLQVYWDQRAYNQRYSALNPGWQAEWRRVQRELSGKPAKPHGRPRKKIPGFLNFPLQIRNVVKNQVPEFELIHT